MSQHLTTFISALHVTKQIHIIWGVTPKNRNKTAPAKIRHTLSISKPQSKWPKLWYLSLQHSDYFPLLYYICIMFRICIWHYTVLTSRVERSGKYLKLMWHLKMMKNPIFWDVKSFDSSKNQCFGGMKHLQHHGDKNQWASNNVNSN
jgi:hypothetical protein